MKTCTFLALYFFQKFHFKFKSQDVDKSRLGRRLGFDLRQCLFDIIDRFPNNETRIMIDNFNLRGLILMKLEK